MVRGDRKWASLSVVYGGLNERMDDGCCTGCARLDETARIDGLH